MTHPNRDLSAQARLAKAASHRFVAAAMVAFCLLPGCATVWKDLQNKENEKPGEYFERSKQFFTDGNYEAAFKENQRVFAEGQHSPDVALFNMGLISAYSLNPKKDYSTALHSFRTLVRDYPQSPLAEQSKVWIHVLEEHQKFAEEKLKLAEEKRALSREREMLSLEREKLKYTTEKSRQVDIEIEKRRRRTLMR